MSHWQQFVWFFCFLVVAVALILGFCGLYDKVKRRFFGVDRLIPKVFITPNEVDFFKTLKQAAGPRRHVFAQVSMGALMDTALKPAHRNFWEARLKFSSKICDFVICDATTLAPLLIVELDDVMHDFNKDKLRDAITARAGYRTLRFWSRKKPTLAELTLQLDRALALNL